MSNSLREQMLKLGLVTPEQAAKPAPVKTHPTRPKGPDSERAGPTSTRGKPPAKHFAAKSQGGARPPIAKNMAPAAKPDPNSSLAAAYKARAEQERLEAEAKKRQAEAKAQAKRERKQKAMALIAGKSLNRQAETGATLEMQGDEVARHFHYGNKIRRLYVTPEQRNALNVGELGIVQMDGKFFLLPDAIVAEVQSFAPEFVALRGASNEPEANVGSGEYADAKFQIPDDLIW